MIHGGHALGGAQDRRPVRVHPVGPPVAEIRENVSRGIFRAADFLDHDLLLALDFLGVENRVPHGVGQNIHRSAQGDTGYGRVIDGDIEGRVRVDASPSAFDFSGHFAHAAAGRALEEHVLMKMGQARFVRAFIGGAHTRPDLDVGDWNPMCFPEQQGEPVFELLVVDVFFSH